MSQTLRSPRHEALRSLIELFAREHSVVSWVLPFVVYQTRLAWLFLDRNFSLFSWMADTNVLYHSLLWWLEWLALAGNPIHKRDNFPQLVLVQQSYRLVVDAGDRAASLALASLALASLRRPGS